MYNQYNNMGMWPNNSFQNFPRKSINWNSILNNTQRTLGIINQAIPIVYQVRPLINNARTLFRVASAINDNDEDETDNNISNENSYNSSSSSNLYNEKKDSNGPIFYL